MRSAMVALDGSIRFHPFGPLTVLAALWIAIDGGAESRLDLRGSAVEGLRGGRRLDRRLAGSAQPGGVIESRPR